MREPHVVADFVRKRVFEVDGLNRAARIAPWPVGKPRIVVCSVRYVADAGRAPVRAGVDYERDEVGSARRPPLLDRPVRPVAGFRAGLDDAEDLVVDRGIFRIDRHNIDEAVPEIRVQAGIDEDGVHLRDLRDGEIGDARVFGGTLHPFARAVVEDEHYIDADRRGRDDVVVERIAWDGRDERGLPGDRGKRGPPIYCIRFDFNAAAAPHLRQIHLFDIRRAAVDRRAIQTARRDIARFDEHAALAHNHKRCKHAIAQMRSERPRAAVAGRLSADCQRLFRVAEKLDRQRIAGRDRLKSKILECAGRRANDRIAGRGSGRACGKIERVRRGGGRERKQRTGGEKKYLLHFPSPFNLMRIL